MWQARFVDDAWKANFRFDIRVVWYRDSVAAEPRRGSACAARQPGPGDLSPTACRVARHTILPVEVSNNGGQRRKAWWPDHDRSRFAHHSGRALAARLEARRAPAAGQCGAGRDVARGSAPGGQSLRVAL